MEQHSFITDHGELLLHQGKPGAPRPGFDSVLWLLLLFLLLLLFTLQLSRLPFGHFPLATDTRAGAPFPRSTQASLSGSLPQAFEGVAVEAAAREFFAVPK